MYKPERKTHYVSGKSKMYVLKYVAHDIRERVFKEIIDGKKNIKNKAKAQNWMNAIIGKYHIKEMDEPEVIHLIAELYCKMTTGHSLKSIIKGTKPKSSFTRDKYWKQIIKIPITKLALFFGIIKYK